MTNAAELVQKDRLQRDFNSIRELSKDPGGGVTRLAYSETETKAHNYVVSEAAKIGLKATTDSVGNLYIKLGEGDRDIIRIGSHLDSVNNGGNYDGSVGVMASLEALRCLMQAKAKLNYPVELVVFRAEESARFRRGCIGSEMATGEFTVKDAKILKDKDGVTVYDAMRRCGYDPEGISDAVWDASKTRLFLEPHIEQGRVLEEEQIPIGVVTGIASPARHIINVEGVYDHSGATPMNLRKDAVAAAAEMIVTAEKIGKDAFENEKPTVVTVGNVVVPYGSINKVAGKATFYLDIRDTSISDRDNTEKRILEEFRKISERRGVKISAEETQRTKPAIVKEEVQTMLVDACKKRGVKYRLIVSGAAQDTQQIANHGIPAGMIFVPSRNGISHSPEEYTEIGHIVTATKVFTEAILEEQRR